MEGRLGNLALGQWFLHALFPEYCVRCENEGAVLCRRCRLFWIAEPIMERFSKETHSVRGIFSVSPYPDPIIKGLLRRWKYHGEERSGEMLLQLLQETLDVYAEALPVVDAVTFVPLHRLRYNERGFDQAAQIAQTTADVLDRPFFHGLLRTKRTAQQAKLSDEDRVRAIEAGAFKFLSQGQVIPKRILLVDDVWTTGTTLRSAARVLRQAGAEEVWAFTLARG